MLPVVLVPLIPQVPALLKEGGHLLLAGIITEKEAVIRETLSANGLMVEESLHMGDWVGLITRLKTDED